MISHVNYYGNRYACLNCNGTLLPAHDDESGINPVWVHGDTMSQFCRPRWGQPDWNRPVPQEHAS